MFEWLVKLIDDAGLVGVFLLMVLENLFPPIPSEVIMPLAGFTAARGQMSIPA
jgi:membrane protein DedA with SNARE-associated domain